MNLLSSSLASPRRRPAYTSSALALVVALSVGACGDDDHDHDHDTDTSTPTDTVAGDAIGDTATTPTVPEHYAFESAFLPGVSSVNYTGQTMRHVLIMDLQRYIQAMTTAIDSATFAPDTAGQVVSALDFYFRFDSDSDGGESIGLSTDPAALQSVYDDISTNKSIVDKLAGNDPSTDYVDWTDGGFKGWSDAALAAHGGGIDSPEAFVVAIFSLIEKQAIDRAVDGIIPDGPDGQPLPVHVTPDGWDLDQLLQKFLTGAVAFHQAADDYLDDDVAGKGLLASNVPASESDAWTPLEHQWDEGFGYFGAAIDYKDYTDDLLASTGYRDSDEDGAIDLLTEYNFGHSTNAAKRDRGAKAGGETDLTGDAIDAFLTGRAIIAAAAGRELTEAELDALKEQRDKAILAWEKAIAATALHYVNDVLKSMATFGTDDYDYLTHAKRWAELKGFALSLQFNPRSPTRGETFDELHTLIGDRPVLPGADTADIDAYRVALREARALLLDAYDFPAANLGGDNGEDGW